MLQSLKIIFLGNGPKAREPGLRGEIVFMVNLEKRKE